VVFEDTFDDLMEQIGHDQLMNVGMWKVMGKWLKKQ
jgi:hypothetical protein